MKGHDYVAPDRTVFLLAAAIVAALLAAAALAGAEPAHPATSFKVAPGGKLWLQGDSTLHAYSSKATKIEVTAAFDGALPAAPDEARAAVAKGALKSLSLALPVSGLKSGEDGLDKNLRKALKEDQAPVIRFALVGYQAGEAKDGGLLVRAHGRLAIAGVEKDATVEATCRFGPDGIALSGAKELLMSDFGIKPPTMMLGTIKTADKVVVHFDLKLQADAATPAP